MGIFWVGCALLEKTAQFCSSVDIGRQKKNGLAKWFVFTKFGSDI
jgi:hypothetical protein